jgi:limonene-1,2-epoxide hydrolase
MGGAIFNMQGALTIRDSTVAANTALGGADEVSDRGKGIAGAIFNLNGTFTAVGSTFANNAGAYYASQIYNLDYDGSQARVAQATLRDTIVADGVGSVAWPFDLASDKSTYNIAPPSGSAANADVSQFDLVRTMNAQEQGSVTGLPLVADPRLGPLQANGGPTETMAPMPGSPAIAAGDPGCLDLAGMALVTDQRGVPRPQGAACDIGAYEVAPPSASTGAASAISAVGAHLAATVTPNSGDAAVHFDYGTTSAYGSQTAVQHLAGVTASPVATTLSGLSAHTTYHFRVVATSPDGTAVGADRTFTTAAGGAVVRGVMLSPTAFAAAPNGPSALAARLHRRYGTKATFTLNEPADVRFTVVQPQPGRVARSGRCVKPTPKSRRAPRCTRLRGLHGSFTRSGAAGANHFRFSGRLAGHKLKLGRYKLVATPRTGGKPGPAASAAFRIIK